MACFKLYLIACLTFFFFGEIGAFFTPQTSIVFRKSVSQIQQQPNYLNQNYKKIPLQMASSVPSAREPKKDWPFWFILPIAPYQKRDTLVEEVVKGKIWTFDQVQGILYVIVPIRMTVVKMESGGLFVYAPVAPTEEVIRELRKLEAEHGPVKHIVLPTLGLEHKVFAGPFSQKFPKAEVWYTPGQYSFPFKLPLSWLGFGFNQKVKELPRDGQSTTPFFPEFDYRLIGPLLSKNKIGGYGEAVFFHKNTKTLLVTDVVVQVSTEIPKIIEKDPRALLFHARDNALERVEDTPAVRAKGWRHLQQFALFFQPSSLETVELGPALEEAKKSPMKELGWGGLYPFVWNKDDSASFKALQAKGGLLVAPILQTLLLNRQVDKVVAWKDEVAKFPFERIIPCHLKNNIKATPNDWLEAFSFLEDVDSLPGILKPNQLLQEDLDFLYTAEEGLVKAGTLFPKDEKVPSRPLTLPQKISRVLKNVSG
mmetsp:Transcript_31025/g.39991  ORF Transcript_31025/g.39991 Transcript_31025/m.39991 type:complete len:481 (+) Transcript_31025:73-1515(+)